MAAVKRSNTGGPQMLAKRLPDDAPTGFEFLKAANSQVGAANDDATIDVFPLPSYVGTMSPLKTMPIMYFCRGGVSDRHWIAQRMRCIPEHLKHFAAEQYERLYQNGTGREQANRWLDAVARKYRGGL
jgi:hypothetical protein